METTLVQQKVGVRRRTGGGLTLYTENPKHPEYPTYQSALGVTLGDFLGRLNASEDFLLLTSFRAVDHTTDPPRVLTQQENVSTFLHVPQAVHTGLHTKALRAYWFMGHWRVDSDQPAQLVDQLEHSWLLIPRDEKVTGAQLLAVGTSLAQKHSQDSFIARVAGETTVRSRTGGITAHLSTDEDVVDAWGALAQARAQDGFPAASYTVPGDGKPHAIEFFLVARPESISGYQLFAAIGISNRG